MSMMVFLSLICLTPARVAGDLQEKYTHLARRSGPLRGLVYPQTTSAQIRTPLVSKYVPQENTFFSDFLYDICCKMATISCTGWFFLWGSGRDMSFDSFSGSGTLLVKALQ
jgi:hypothetical protein